ncbi:hypothetical protein [Rahnella woolbedingensis]|uniref:hypothetical protein n=1 Tax=Rahnella woolbedingensis TaxID=1510574 RepID=UPI0011C41433|nr:hypothetical protein [Rahnella woolbedingensis]
MPEIHNSVSCPVEPSHASSEALSGVCRRDLNHDYHNHRAFQNASHVPENLAESCAILNFSDFLVKEFFFQRNGAL